MLASGAAHCAGADSEVLICILDEGAERGLHFVVRRHGCCTASATMRALRSPRPAPSTGNSTDAVLSALRRACAQACLAPSCGDDCHDESGAGLAGH